MFRPVTIASCIAMLFVHAQSQHYTALDGSAFGGSLSVLNNPASHAVYNQPWELTVAGINAYVQRNNTIDVLSGPLRLLSGLNMMKASTGSYSRYLREHGQLNLLNFCITLNENNFLAMGISGRSYAQLHTSHINYQDDSKGATGFLKLNKENDPVNAAMVTNNWVEVYLTYGHTVYRWGYQSMTIGASLKFLKGSGGAYAQVTEGRIEPINDGTTEDNLVTNATVDYAMSRNLERIKKNSGTSAVIEELFSGTNLSLGMDVGVEFVQYRVSTHNGYTQYLNPENHDWKIGVSVLDIGRLKYGGGVLGERLRDIMPGVTGNVLDEKFSDINFYETFGDTLATLFNTQEAPLKQLVLPLPARIILNGDKFIRESIYLNAQVSIPLRESNWNSIHQVTEAPHLILTPRWEIPAGGVYMPFLLTAGGEFMPGLALRFGPLVAGVHDITRFGNQRQFDKGGYYLAFRIRPGMIPAGEKACPEF